VALECFRRPKGTVVTDHKPLVQEFYAAMRPGQDVDAMVDRFMAEDFVEHEAIPGMGSTRDTPRQLFKMMLAAFPDFHVTVHELLQDGDKVTARVTFSGTHSGEFMGLPASNNKVDWNAIDILQFRGDKVAAHWGVMDMADAMNQMGGRPQLSPNP
jgi:steroid delta-isomerase-like uncharacterized protein